MSSGNNIVTAAFAKHRLSAVTRSLWQWDYGITLRFDGLDLPAAYSVHFSNEANEGASVTMVGTADGVQIPDAYLKTGMPVYAFVYLHTGEDDGETVYTAMVPVKRRPEPTDEEPTPEQQSAFEQMMVYLQGAADAEEERKSAESIREENEAERAEAETQRDSGEVQRIAQEASRVSSELARIEAETDRAAAENERRAAESGRRINEEAREALANELRNISATAETLAPGGDATANYSHGRMTFGIPRGEKGDIGHPGIAPIIRDGTWWRWDNDVGDFVDTGIDAQKSIDMLILVQDTQPVDEDNKIWIRETAADSVRVPTVADMEAALAEKAGVEVTGRITAVESEIAAAATEETGQALVGKAEELTLLIGAALDTVAGAFENMPQDEPLQEIVAQMAIGNALIDQLYRELDTV